MKDQHKQDLIRKHAGKAGKTGKIAAKCIECVYDPTAAGTWRKQVENCSCIGCPLYSIRPKPVVRSA